MNSALFVPFVVDPLRPSAEARGLPPRRLGRSRAKLNHPPPPRKQSGGNRLVSSPSWEAGQLSQGD